MRLFLLLLLTLPVHLGCAEDVKSNFAIRTDSELFQKNNKWGVKSSDGGIIVEPKWDLIGYPSTLSNDRLVVSKDGKFGFLDSKGKLAIDLVWDYASKFANGLAPVARKGKYGYINTNGDIVVPLNYDSAGHFSDNRAPVRQEGMYGFINNQGKLVIPFKWKEAEPFSEGFARVALEPFNFGFIDQDGDLITELKWHNAFFFSDGLAAVKDETKWGFINTAGELVIEPQWKVVRPYYKGFAIVADSLNRTKAKYGIIDKKGNAVTPIKWESIERIDDSTFKVLLNEKHTLLELE